MFFGSHFIISFGVVLAYHGLLTKGAQCPEGRAPADLGTDMAVTVWPKGLTKADANRVFRSKHKLELESSAAFTVVPKQKASLTLVGLTVTAMKGSVVYLTVKGPQEAKYTATFSKDKAVVKLPAKGIKKITSLKILIKPIKGQVLLLKSIYLLFCKGINECAEKPCLHGTCKDEKVGYSCTCDAGWTGKNCGRNIDDCSPNPCANKGECHDELNGYRCECKPGYRGTNCGRDINECASNPCIHGRCTDLVNAYKCNCDAGFTGKNCRRNIDECASNPCLNGGKCVDLVANYRCRCKQGWTGKRCGQNIDDCASNPCKRGQCKDQLNGYTCKCDPGWEGINCDQDIDECAPKPCGKRGICTDRVNRYECFCKKGWAGKNCKIRADIDDRCPPNYMRFDLNAERASFYNLRIVPNHNDQDPAWGLMDAKFKDGKDAFLRLMSNDRYIIELKKIPGALLYIGKLCMRTFVVDLVTLSYIDKRHLSQPTIHRMVPVKGPEWFRLSCTPDVTKFQRVDSITIEYKHQPPNFNMKDMEIEACIPLGVI